MASSKFEEAARAAKVARIVATVPCGRSGREMAQIADFFAALPQPDRDRVASAAGVPTPSAETWAAVVEALRQRRAAGEVFKSLDLLAQGRGL